MYHWAAISLPEFSQSFSKDSHIFLRRKWNIYYKVQWTLEPQSWYPHLWKCIQCAIFYRKYSPAPQSKNAVSTNTKHSRYIHLMSNFSSIHFHTKRLYVHTFDLVDTLFSYERGLIDCLSLQEFSQTKESTLLVI